jgi:hypothetical protein
LGILMRTGSLPFIIAVTCAYSGIRKRLTPGAAAR